MLLNVFLISLVVVFVLDITDFYENISSYVVRWITRGKFKQPKYVKPFSCSLCMSFWVGVLYLLMVGKLSILSVAFCALMALLTPVWKDVLLCLRDMMLKCIDNIRTFFEINY